MNLRARKKLKIIAAVTIGIILAYALPELSPRLDNYKGENSMMT